MCLRTLVSTIFVLAFSLPSHSTELKGNPEELKRFLHPTEDTITINGEAKETAYSDKAIIQLIVTTEKDKLADALTANTKLRSMIRKSLTESGVKLTDINTSKFSTSPQFGWFGDNPDSYKVINRMAVNIFNESQLRDIAKITDQYESIELSQTSYEHTKRDEFLLKVKQTAIADVLKQKAFYEKQLNVKLTTKSFGDSKIYSNATRGSQAFMEKVVVTGSRLKRSRKPQAFDPVVTSPQSFDEVEYKANIWVNFVVNPK